MAEKKKRKINPKVKKAIEARTLLGGIPDVVNPHPEYKVRMEAVTRSSIGSDNRRKVTASRNASKNSAALQRASQAAKIANPTSKENSEEAEGRAMGLVMMDVAKEVGVKDPQAMTDSEYEYVMNVSLQKQDSFKNYYDKMLRDILDRQNNRGDINEAKNGVEQDPDVKDKPGTQPKKYYKDVDKEDKEARAAQFRKGSESEDDDETAYEPAPGDEDAETKPSKYTKAYDKKFKKESVEITEVFNKGVRKKAKETGIPYSILIQVFKRGKAAWKTGHRPGTTPDQWAFARINSFATGGKTRRTADKDLWKKYQEYKKKKKKKKTKSEEYLEEAKYQGKTVKLGDPTRNSSGSKKKFRVYVTHPQTGNVVKVEFGDPNMEIRRDNPKRLKSFRARHGCDVLTYEDDRHTAKYWSCKMWEKGKKVSDLD